MYRIYFPQGWAQTSASTWFLLTVGIVAVLGAGILAGLQGRTYRQKNAAKNTGRRRSQKNPNSKRREQKWLLGRKKHAACDLGLVCLEVATRLEAGSSPDQAWRACLSQLHPGLQLEDLRHPEQLPTPALRRLFRTPAHRRAARAVVAATDLSRQLGCPLAQVLAQCAHAISGATRAALERQSAQTGPRSTARLLGVLPLVALLGGAALGVDLGTMLTTPGWVRVSFILGLIALAVGNLWTYCLIRHAATAQGAQIDAAWAMQLCAAALQAGTSIPHAIDALGQCVGDKNLQGCGKMLILGADWEETWQRAGPTWQDLAKALRPAWEDGASPVPLLEAGARNQNEQAAYGAKIAAEKLAVRLVLPMGICLLPAFLALGVVPVIISTVDSLLL